MKIQTQLWLAVLISILSLTSSALATPRVDTNLPLFYAISDAFNDRLQFSLTVDDDSDVTGLIFSQNSGDTPIALADLPKGIVLYQSSGMDVVTLSSQNFNSQTGGDFTLKYLNNGISGTYRSFSFSVGRQGQNWSPYILDSRQVPQVFVSMYLKAKKVLGKVVGIDSITLQ